MKKIYLKPEMISVELDNENQLMAGSNKLDNGEDGEAGAKGFRRSRRANIDEWLDDDF